MSKKVVIIEDEKSLGKAVEMQLSKEYNVSWYRSADDARGNTEDADLILLDIVMPGTDGLSFLKELREDPSHKGKKIVMMSNLDRNQEREQAEEHDATAYIVKANTGLAALAEKVKMYLEDDFGITSEAEAEAKQESEQEVEPESAEKAAAA